MMTMVMMMMMMMIIIIMSWDERSQTFLATIVRAAICSSRYLF